MHGQRDKAGLGYRALQSQLHYTSCFLNKTFSMHAAFTNLTRGTFYNICIFVAQILVVHITLTSSIKPTFQYYNFFYTRLAVLLIKELLTPGENMFIL